MASDETHVMDRLGPEALRLGLDVAAVEAVSALRAAGVESILLRGPALARWLYGPVGRDYSDIDLLVAPGDFRKAEEILAARGFARSAIAPPARQAQFLRRDRDGAAIDLHRAIVGMRASPDDCWQTLASRVEPMPLAGSSAPILDHTARALVVALHAAQHGTGKPQPVADLSRALERLHPAEWVAAARLAERCDATEAFGAGLRLLPAGEAVAGRLGLSERASVETLLRLETAVDTSLAFERLAKARGVGAKLRLVSGRLAPGSDFMRAWTPLARRGVAGLVLAYAWRTVWLAWRAPAGFRAWRLARRRSR